MPMVKVEKNLTEEEVNERAKLLVSKLNEIDRLDQEKKDFGDNIKAQVKVIEGDVDKLRSAVSFSRDEFEYDCTAEKDFENKVIRYYDAITGDFIKEEPMKPSDAQLSLDAREDIENTADPMGDVNALARKTLLDKLYDQTIIVHDDTVDPAVDIDAKVIQIRFDKSEIVVEAKSDHVQMLLNIEDYGTTFWLPGDKDGDITYFKTTANVQEEKDMVEEMF